MSERLTVAHLPRDPEESFDTRGNVTLFVFQNGEFANLRADLQGIATEKAVDLIDAPDHVVSQRLHALYENRKYGSFNHFEKRRFGTLEEVRTKYVDLFHKKVEEDGVSPAEASAHCRKEKRIEVATREARNEFAKALNYVPGLDGKPGANDYHATTTHPDFVTADRLVREAVGKFS